MEYRIRVHEALRVARVRAWKRTPYWLTAIVVVLSIFGVVNRAIPDLWLILISTFLLGVVAIIAGMFLGLKRRRKEIESYCLTLVDNVISRNQAGLAPVSMDIDDISRVERNTYRTLLVHGADRKLAFGIPHTLEQLPEVVSVLEERVSIDEYTASTARRLGGAASYLGLALIPVFMYVRRPEIVFIAGILLSALLVMWALSILKHKNTSNWVKGVMGTAIVLIFASLIIPGLIQAGRVLFR